ncbi:MAG: alcohol dehydrogenase catalytic domain-containing protein [Propionibacterium acidifaciens]
MRAAVFVEPGVVRVEDRPEPVIEKPTDALVRVTDACVCGSDLWWFRGISPREHGSLTGHEAMGVVEEVGSAVSSLAPGDFVIVPFTHGCGVCPVCRAGFDADCPHTEPGGNAGYQAEYLRATNADGALVAVPGAPGDHSDRVRRSLLTLSDVMATGYHAARMAEVGPGATAVVLGDGAVGLSGVLGARMLGAERIIAMSRHEDRQRIATDFGATDIVPERGDEAVARVLELTDRRGRRRRRPRVRRLRPVHGDGGRPGPPRRRHRQGRGAPRRDHRPARRSRLGDDLRPGGPARRRALRVDRPGPRGHGRVRPRRRAGRLRGHGRAQGGQVAAAGGSRLSGASGAVRVVDGSVDGPSGGPCSLPGEGE